ncbi:MAG: cobalamin-binding protein [Bacteroidetes bacterium B1(2017)]|nr:MAG: cobalamin-binding protein [Bacteroidetes bacterium B1(2017)]
MLVDQMGNRLDLPEPPKRIISLVPSQTEYLYALGLTDEVIAQTLFCIHPAQMHQAKPRVGGTKNLNLQKIRELKPDLIIGNKEENTKAQIEELSQEFPIYMSDINCLEDAIEMMQQIGVLVNRQLESKRICDKIQANFQALVRTETPKTCLYLIWREPWMAAGSNTFIGDMMAKIGLKNLVLERYPSITQEWLTENQPDLIFLSSEPYPFKTKHIEELQSHCPHAKIQLVDGELFSWYGSRLIQSRAYFQGLFKT